MTYLKSLLGHCLTVLLFVSSVLSAQERPLDSISIRKTYPLPSPTLYEAYYDIEMGLYYISPKVGDLQVGPAVAMSPQQYADFVSKNKLKTLFRDKLKKLSLEQRSPKTESEKKNAFKLPSLTIKSKLFEAIFGGNKIELIPQGFASFDLGVLYQRIENPMILPQNRKNLTMNIQQRMQFGITGKVGQNLNLRMNYDTQSGFAFENRMNLAWQSLGSWSDLQSKGFSKTDPEDRIIKKVEFGNVNMPLSTSLIRGSESLFGLKTDFQLGKTTGTLVVSQQQGEARTVQVQGGGVTNTFRISAVDYEENQHYFLGHYFLQNYDRALENYPVINSQINIQRLEVYVLDQGVGNLQNQKTLIALRDLGEGASGVPDNQQNGLYQQISSQPGIRDLTSAYGALNGQLFSDFQGNQVAYQDGENFIYNRRARRLDTSEYTFQPQLGYISLAQKLNDNQLLAVSFSYTINGESRVYKVGEFSEEANVMIAKLIKPNVSVKVTSPMWNLMMKNVYSLNTNGLENNNFFLNVFYRAPNSGRVNYLPNTSVADTNLLRLLNWDRLNLNNDLQGGQSLGDGLFDFVPGITVDPVHGKLIFTKVQPFGSYMRQVLGADNPQYVFSDLYSRQKQVASQSSLAQRYTLEGRYQGGQGGEGISLGAINVPQGSVKVMSNGMQLIEGQDYIVNYMLGQVTIINDAIKQSGQPVQVSLENQLNFNNQRKRFLGLNLERKLNKHLTFGGTIVNYSESPLTQKVQLGNESVNNTMFGLNVFYQNEFPFLTRLVDKIPLVQTNAASNLSFRAEAAYLLPRTNSTQEDQSYIDDFEQTTSKISLKEPGFWNLGARPEKNLGDPVFGMPSMDNLSNGFGRALASWYYIDPRFYNVGGRAPQGINAESVSNHASRKVLVQEVYNNRDFVAGEQTLANTFDISIYPKEKGPYNFNPLSEDPASRWAALTRPITVSNFTQSNIEYVEFWMMDPHADGQNIGKAPRLLVQLGNVSEDILKDGRMAYESGLPTPSVPKSTTTSQWGKQPEQLPLVYAFDNNSAERRYQDAGFDGLSSQEEMARFNNPFVNPVTGEPDPSQDDFVFYLSDRFQGGQASSLIERYKYFRNPENNSQANSLEVSSQAPDSEDANRDLNMDQTEDYNQYTVHLDQANLVLGKNYIVDIKEVSSRFQNGQQGTNKWYLFRIPVNRAEDSGYINDPAILNNVRFARLVLTGFEQTSTLRFGTLDLVRSEWRKYTRNIDRTSTEPEGSVLQDVSGFDVGSVNLEENAQGTPPYVMPPGIQRQILSGNAGAQRQNEASLYMRARNLTHEGRAVFKNVALDMRRFSRLELFVHAHEKRNGLGKLDPNAKFFIRLGSDATDNYYEYEAPLYYTDTNAKSPVDIWPMQNRVNILTQHLLDAKIARDQSLGINQLDERFRVNHFNEEGKAIYVKGRPSLGNITTLVLGVRNDDAVQKDIVLWVNEVRLSGIENQGGYAGNASLNMNLADLASINAAGAFSTIGFGAIVQKPVERAQSSLSSFNINTTVNVDKFFPEKMGLRIPVNYTYAQSIEDPKYNPLNSDIKFEKDPNKEQTKKIARTYTQQRSISVLNMRKERVGDSKIRFYHPENFSVSAMYGDDYSRDIYTRKNLRQYLRANVDYNYSFKPWVLKPFNKAISDTARAYKYFKWINDINFNPVPTRVSFQTDLDRTYTELEFRNVDALMSGGNASTFNPIRNRNFYMGWRYSIGFNFTKSFKAEINSATRTINDNFQVQELSDRSIFMQPFRIGRPVTYNHRMQFNYRLPFEELPGLDFLNAELGYGVQYNWTARSTALLNENLGNLAQNTNVKTAVASVDIPRLLNKFDYFQRIQRTLGKHKQELDSLNGVYTSNYEKNAKKTGYKPYRFKNRLSLVQTLVNSLTSIKQVDLNFNENNGTVLPGILSDPNFIGMGKGVGGPGIGFLFGSQADIRREAITRGWISGSNLMNDAYMQTHTQTLNGTMQIQPLTDLRIDLNIARNYIRNLNQAGYNRLIDDRFSFVNETLTQTLTDFTLGSSFRSANVFYNQFLENARTLSRSYGGILRSDGFVEGYSRGNQYILMPAFTAALHGRDVTGKEDPSPVNRRFPLPNWRLTYSGLRQIPFVAANFTKFDIMHAYNSTTTISGIQSNLEYYNNPAGLDSKGDRLNPFIVSQVGVVEDFAPFLGADITLRNNLQIRAMYNRNRTYLLGLVNATLTEDIGSEYVVGAGYVIRDVPFRFRFKGQEKAFKSDINIRGDFALRDSQTRITNILLDDAQVTGGQRMMAIKLTADYNLTQNFSIKFFYDHLLTSYKISTAFPLATIRAGLTLSLTLGQ